MKAAGCFYIPLLSNTYDDSATHRSPLCISILATILHSPFFQRIRQWQDEYGYGQPAEKVGNWLCPCVIHDHFDVFFKAVQDTQAKPIDKEAIDALADTGYHSGMVAYGSDYNHLSDKVWSEHYMAKQTVNS